MVWMKSTDKKKEIRHKFNIINIFKNKADIHFKLLLRLLYSHSSISLSNRNNQTTSECSERFFPQIHDLCLTIDSSVWLISINISLPQVWASLG